MFSNKAGGRHYTAGLLLAATLLSGCFQPRVPTLSPLHTACNEVNGHFTDWKNTMFATNNCKVYGKTYEPTQIKQMYADVYKAQQKANAQGQVTAPN